jgi:DNA polymerase III subunit epsilon
MNTVLIIDLETTGLDPETDSPIELGAILYSISEHCTIQQISTLFPVVKNPAENINHISVKASQTVRNTELVMTLFKKWVNMSDYLVAHNVEFDRKWFGKGILPVIDKPWLCTYDDFIWPNNSYPTSLVNTALNHGIGVNQAHRALTDCQLIALLFDRIPNFEYLLKQAVQRSIEPKISIIAKVSYDDKQQAKDRGFKFDWDNKKWVKKIRLREYEREKSEYPFPIIEQYL